MEDDSTDYVKLKFNINWIGRAKLPILCDSKLYLQP